MSLSVPVRSCHSVRLRARRHRPSRGRARDPLSRRERRLLAPSRRRSAPTGRRSSRRPATSDLAAPPDPDVALSTCAYTLDEGRCASRPGPGRCSSRSRCTHAAAASSSPLPTAPRSAAPRPRRHDPPSARRGARERGPGRALPRRAHRRAGREGLVVIRVLAAFRASARRRPRQRNPSPARSIGSNPVPQRQERRRGRPARRCAARRGRRLEARRDRPFIAHAGEEQNLATRLVGFERRTRCTVGGPRERTRPPLWLAGSRP